MSSIVPHSLLSSVLLFLPLAAWAVLLNVVGFYTWGYGPSTFVCLTLTAALLLYLRRDAHLHLRPAMRGRCSKTIIYIVLASILAVVTVPAVLDTVDGFRADPGRLIDISANTYAAIEHFVKGNNPYTHVAQLGYRLDPGMPHTEVVGDEILMFGVPYHYGYPYFPVMLMSYLPFYYLVDGYASVRYFNLLLVVLNIVGITVLSYRLSGGRAGYAAPLVAVVAYLCIAVYPREIFDFGIVDVLISTLATYAFVFLSFRKYWAGGILLGLAQGAKLLPAPFLILAVALYMFGRSEMPRVLWGYLLAAAVTILPFLIWNPEAFLSATVLFYLTNHAGGDNTALWYYLPGYLKHAFQVVGIVLALAAVVTVSRTRNGSLMDAMTAAFVAYVIFVAFGRMTHLNYLWAVFPLGCVSLAVSSTRLLRLEDRRIFRLESA